MARKKNNPNIEMVYTTLLDIQEKIGRLEGRQSLIISLITIIIVTLLGVVVKILGVA